MFSDANGRFGSVSVLKSRFSTKTEPNRKTDRYYMKKPVDRDSVQLSILFGSVHFVCKKYGAYYYIFYFFVLNSYIRIFQNLIVGGGELPRSVHMRFRTNALYGTKKNSVRNTNNLI